MLKDSTIVQTMEKTSLRMNADFNIGSVYSSVCTFSKQEYMRLGNLSAREILCNLKHTISLRKLVISVNIKVDSIFI